MKKVILSAAFAIAAFSGANAITGSAANVSFTGNYIISIPSILTMSPSTTFGNATTTFNTLAEMSAGISTGSQEFTINASRSWKVTAQASNFLRTGGAATGIEGEFAAADVMTMKTSLGTTAGGAVNTTAGFMAVSNTPLNIANSNGGINKKFTLEGKITPGFTHNLEGTYTSGIQVIASLD